MATVTETPDAPPTMATPTPGVVRRGWNRVASGFEWMFGLWSMFLWLAVLDTSLIVSFLVLCYLLEVSGRISRSGRLRDGFIGIRTMARLGGIALGGFLLWLPLYGMSIFAENAAIIDPGGTAAKKWR